MKLLKNLTGYLVSLIFCLSTLALAQPKNTSPTTPIRKGRSVKIEYGEQDSGGGYYEENQCNQDYSQTPCPTNEKPYEQIPQPIEPIEYEQDKRLPPAHEQAPISKPRPREYFEPVPKRKVKPSYDRRPSPRHHEDQDQDQTERDFQNDENSNQPRNNPNQNLPNNMNSILLCQQATQILEYSKYTLNQAYVALASATNYCSTSLCLYPYQVSYNNELQKFQIAQINVTQLCRL